MAIETARPDEMPGATPEERLAAFRDLIRAKTAIEMELAQADATGRYTDRRGIMLERRFRGPGQVGGRPVSFRSRPLVETPWARQPLGGNLVLTDGKTDRVYDFQNWTITQGTH